MKKSTITNILAGIGLGISLVLFIMKTGSLPCGSDTCGEVLNSAYGEIFGIPVSIFSLILWILILTNTKIPKLESFYQTQSQFWYFIGMGIGKEIKNIHEKIYAILILVGSVIFIAIQKFIIGHFCPFCVSHAIVGIIYAIMVFKSTKQFSNTPNYGLYGILIATAFITIASKEKTYAVTLPIAGPITNIEIPNVEVPIETSNNDDAEVLAFINNKLENATPIKIKTPEPTVQAVPQPQPQTNYDFQGLKWNNQNLVDASNSTIRAYSLTCNHCRVEILKKLKNGERLNSYLINVPTKLEPAMIQIYGIAQTQKKFEDALIKVFENYHKWIHNTMEETYKITGFQSLTPQMENQARLKILQQQNTLKKFKVKRYPSNIQLPKK
jgi:uncharacterized membrane protein